MYSPSGIPSNTENTEFMKYRVIISNREIGDDKFNHNKYLFQMLTVRFISDKGLSINVDFVLRYLVH